MRILPVALLVFASIVQAGDKAEPFLLRGKVLYEQALAIVEKADQATKPAMRHKLLGRALQANTRASDLAMAACREITADNRARVLAFLHNVRGLDGVITSDRAQFHAPTDISVQRVRRYKPNATILRVGARLEQLQKLRRNAADTPANLVRMARRETLNKWRLARIAARVGSGAK